MKTSIVYAPLQEYGFQEECPYKAEISTEGDRVNIHFVFSEEPKGLSKKSSVSMVAISFDRDEAEKLTAALTGILHHPVINNEKVEWEYND